MTYIDELANKIRPTLQHTDVHTSKIGLDNQDKMKAFNHLLKITKALEKEHRAVRDLAYTLNVREDEVLLKQQQLWEKHDQVEQIIAEEFAMRDDIELHLNEEQAGLIMRVMGQVDWENERVGHIAEGIFVELADRDIAPCPEDYLEGDS